MRGAGFTDADFTKPIITVAVPYSNALECNNTLLELARTVVEEIEAAGGIGFYCMTPAISDGNTQASGLPFVKCFHALPNSSVLIVGNRRNAIQSCVSRLDC